MQAQHQGASDDEDAAISDSDSEGARGHAASSRPLPQHPPPFQQRLSQRHDAHAMDRNRQGADTSGGDDSGDEESGRGGQRGRRDGGMEELHRAGADQAAHASERLLSDVVAGVPKRRRTNVAQAAQEEPGDRPARPPKEASSGAGPQPRMSKPGKQDGAQKRQMLKNLSPHEEALHPPHFSAANRAGGGVNAAAGNKQQKSSKAAGGKGRAGQLQRVMLRKKDLTMDLVTRQLQVNLAQRRTYFCLAHLICFHSMRHL